MSFFRPLGAIVLLLSFATPVISYETEHSDIKVSVSSFENEPFIPQQGTLEAKDLTFHKTFVYGSLSFIPGVGVSDRSRNNRKGTALDIKLGAAPFIFDKVSWFPVFTVDYNWLYYARAKKTSPYFSCGIGAAYIVPYIPLRAGIEFQNGFVDVGAKMVWGFIPFPEIRGGFRINF